MLSRRSPIFARMNLPLKYFAVTTLSVISLATFAGESSLTTTYQPLDGLGSGEIAIVAVTCHDWYSHSGQPTAVGLISAPNVPPTNNAKQATANLNLASLSGVRFETSDLGDPSAHLELIMNATQLKASETGYPRENIIRASLECLRRCLPAKLQNTPLTLQATEADKKWLSEIVREFNSHVRSKVFYTPPE
jgi:hypothetical protein